MELAISSSECCSLWCLSSGVHSSPPAASGVCLVELPAALGWGGGEMGKDASYPDTLQADTVSALVQKGFWDCAVDSPSSLPGAEQILTAGLWWHRSYPSLGERCPWNRAMFHLHSGALFPTPGGLRLNISWVFLCRRRAFWFSS